VTVTTEDEDLLARVRRLEDESAIKRVIMTYGPAADGGMAPLAGDLWLEDGVYDWDANGAPHPGSAGVTAMLNTDGHQSLIREGVAHFAGPLMVTVEEDHGLALNYSLIMRREEEGFYLWRVSAVRWDLERRDDGWRVRTRTNRLLDAEREGSALFRTTLEELSAKGQL